ncbi:MAG: hypothetical protein J7J91_01340 [Deltaproteobacteria bacterium]|nr:hypothetical protein [Deltaproteobacteria bacterium]
MVNACECRWSKKEAKALITFLIAEKHRHERDVRIIKRNIQRLRKEYNISEEEYKECEEKATLFIYF